MTSIILFILILIGINYIPELTSKRFLKTEKYIERIVTCATFIFLIMIILSFNGIKLKGMYSNLVIGFIFVTTSILYFAINKNTTRKVISIVVLIPFILLSIYLNLFNKNLGRYKVNDDINIVVSQEGFLACGEMIRLTKSKFIIFDEVLIQESNQCLRGIYKIETVEFNKKRAKFLIYHSEKFDSENPYSYEIGNINYW
jgi:ABC-2 type transport system permease protein